MAEEEAGEEVTDDAAPEPRVEPDAEVEPAGEVPADEIPADEIPADANGDSPGEAGILDLQELEGVPQPAGPSEEPSEDLQPRDIPDLPRSAQDLEAVYEIPIQVSAVLGKSPMHVSQLLKMGRGAVIELDRKVGEAIDIYINNRLVARGEVVVVEDRLGVTMTEIIKTERT